MLARLLEFQHGRAVKIHLEIVDGRDSMDESGEQGAALPR